MLYQTIALSDHWFPRLLRRSRKLVRGFSLPAPRFVVLPLLGVFLVIRQVYYFIARVFFCEPFFRAYCTQCGKNLNMGVYLHWIQGRGDLIVGDNVIFDGKCNFLFATRYSARPTLLIGDCSGLGHNTTITVGDRVTIGKNCRIADGVVIFDVPGHPLDPAMRLEGKPSAREDVKPVVIEDNVWIGRGAIIMPGVTIGEGSVVSAGSVVMTPVPSNVLVAGNPARQLRKLTSDAVN